MTETSRSRKASSDVREFRLEGFGLFLSIAALAIVVGGSFWAGRQWERRQADHSQLPRDERLAEANVAEGALRPPADVDAELTAFDRTDGTVAEPQRELPADRDERSVRQAEPERAEPAIDDTAAPFFVQVFAGRDRSTATTLIDRLERSGYRVRLFTEADGLYKVRVGGYPTREPAREAAGELQAAGYSGAWVTELR